MRLGRNGADGDAHRVKRYHSSRIRFDSHNRFGTARRKGKQMLQFYGPKRTFANQRTCYYLMRVVRSDHQTRPALVLLQDKRRGSLTSKNPLKSQTCTSAPLANPCKPPGKSRVIMRAQRGAPAPLPHCGRGWQAAGEEVGEQRGAPAPLPHCGPRVSAGPRCLLYLMRDRIPLIHQLFPKGAIITTALLDMVFRTTGRLRRNGNKV